MFDEIVTVSKPKDEKAYRLGDCIILQNDAKEAVLEYHQETIAYDYLNHPDCPSIYTIDIDLLKEITESHSAKKWKVSEMTDNESYLSIHLRLGDRKAVKTQKEFDEMISYIDKFDDVDYVYIVTALHLQDEKGRNVNRYGVLDELLKYLKKIGKKNEIVSSISPDKDFCFLHQSHNLICTNGGFSLLAYLCKEENKNRSFILKSNTLSNQYSEKKYGTIQIIKNGRLR